MPVCWGKVDLEGQSWEPLLCAFILWSIETFKKDSQFLSIFFFFWNPMFLNVVLVPAEERNEYKFAATLVRSMTNVCLYTRWVNINYTISFAVLKQQKTWGVLSPIQMGLVLSRDILEFTHIWISCGLFAKRSLFFFF